MKPTSITIFGRRWFDRKWGNTYHSVTIDVDGDQVAYLPYQYGYGDHWEQTATEWLEEHGYINRGRHPNGAPMKNLRMYCEESGIMLSRHVADVSRKRDL